MIVTKSLENFGQFSLRIPSKLSTIRIPIRSSIAHRSIITKMPRIKVIKSTGLSPSVKKFSEEHKKYVETIKKAKPVEKPIKIIIPKEPKVVVEHPPFPSVPKKPPTVKIPLPKEIEKMKQAIEKLRKEKEQREQTIKQIMEELKKKEKEKQEVKKLLAQLKKEKEEKDRTIQQMKQTIEKLKKELTKPKMPVLKPTEITPSAAKVPPKPPKIAAPYPPPEEAKIIPTITKEALLEKLKTPEGIALALLIGYLIYQNFLKQKTLTQI